MITKCIILDIFYDSYLHTNTIAVKYNKNIFLTYYFEDISFCFYDKSNKNIIVKKYKNIPLEQIYSLFGNKESIKEEKLYNPQIKRYSGAWYLQLAEIWKYNKKKTPVVNLDKIDSMIINNNIDKKEDKYHIVEMINIKELDSKFSYHHSLNRMVCDNNTFLHLYSENLIKVLYSDASFSINKKLWQQIQHKTT